MARKTYRPRDVWEYMDEGNKWNYSEVIEGVLIDTIIVYHSDDCIEVWEDTYINPWCSEYTRHIYRKGLPKRWQKALEEEYERLDA